MGLGDLQVEQNSIYLKRIQESAKLEKVVSGMGLRPNSIRSLSQSLLSLKATLAQENAGPDKLRDTHLLSWSRQGTVE
jgi:hypothetical protein